MTDEDHKHICQACAWERVPHARAQRCIREKVLITCTGCGEALSKKQTHCIVPMPKSNCIVVTDPSLLVGLNSSHKGGVR